jgi:hypothetical protein
MRLLGGSKKAVGQPPPMGRRVEKAMKQFFLTAKDVQLVSCSAVIAVSTHSSRSQDGLTCALAHDAALR